MICAERSRRRQDKRNRNDCQENHRFAESEVQGCYRIKGEKRHIDAQPIKKPYCNAQKNHERQLLSCGNNPEAGKKRFNKRIKFIAVSSGNNWFQETDEAKNGFAFEEDQDQKEKRSDRTRKEQGTQSGCIAPQCCEAFRVKEENHAKKKKERHHVDDPLDDDRSKRRALGDSLQFSGNVRTNQLPDPRQDIVDHVPYHHRRKKVRC